MMGAFWCLIRRVGTNVEEVSYNEKTTENFPNACFKRPNLEVHFSARLAELQRRVYCRKRSRFDEAKVEPLHQSGKGGQLQTSKIRVFMELSIKTPFLARVRANSTAPCAIRHDLRREHCLWSRHTGVGWWIMYFKFERLYEFKPWSCRAPTVIFSHNELLQASGVSIGWASFFRGLNRMGRFLQGSQ